MSDLKKKFDAAAKSVRKLAKRPSNDQLLELYALYKQATDGDLQGTRPGMFDMTGRAKYDAWAKQKGKSQDDAMQDYCALATKLKKASA